MNREALSAISRLIGAMGSIVALAYLTDEIRQNTRQLSESG